MLKRNKIWHTSLSPEVVYISSIKPVSKQYFFCAEQVNNLVGFNSQSTTFRGGRLGFEMIMRWDFYVPELKKISALKFFLIFFFSSQKK